MPYIPLQPSAYSHSEISSQGSDGEEEQARQALGLSAAPVRLGFTVHLS